jgi:hypothetical protein
LIATLALYGCLLYRQHISSSKHIQQRTDQQVDMFQRSYSSTRASERQKRQYIGLSRHMGAAMGLLKSRCSCLGAPSLSFVDLPTLDKQQQHGSSGLAVPEVSIDVRCYEDDDQASDRSNSSGGSTGSSNQPRAAAHHQKKSLASLLASKLAKLPGFAGFVGHSCVEDADLRSSSSCSEQGGSTVLEGPVLPAQLQEKPMPAEEQTDDSQVSCCRELFLHAGQELYGESLMLPVLHASAMCPSSPCRLSAAL